VALSVLLVGENYVLKASINVLNQRYYQPSAGRVKEWRLLLQYPGFSPCHLEPYVRFALTRLSDNLRPAPYKVMPYIFLLGRGRSGRTGLPKCLKLFHSSPVLPLIVNEYIHFRDFKKRCILQPRMNNADMPSPL
jgi:hypothetical protein